MATYLITGLRVSLGRPWPGRVLAQGGKVMGFDNFSTGKRENLAEVQDQIEFHETDLAGPGRASPGLPGS